MKLYKLASLSMASVFAIVGGLFLFIPDGVFGFFNTLSSSFGMAAMPLTGFNFFLILAVGYLYLVTVLAVLMFRHPENRYFPVLLVNAKLASSVLSLAFFLFVDRYLIFLVNCLIDGAIGIFVLILARQRKPLQ